MDFELTKSQKLFQQMIKEFAEKEVKPIAAEVDEEEKFPTENIKKLLNSNGVHYVVSTCTTVVLWCRDSQNTKLSELLDIPALPYCQRASCRR